MGSPIYIKPHVCNLVSTTHRHFGRLQQKGQQSRNAMATYLAAAALSSEECKWLCAHCFQEGMGYVGVEVLLSSAALWCS
jgi:hypothetical protein